MSEVTKLGVAVAGIEMKKGVYTYREAVLRTCPKSDTQPRTEQLALGALGLSGEAGEVADLIKKHLFHGKAMPTDTLIKELGDVRWYLEYLLIVNSLTMEEVEAANVEKLRKRYPNGFNFEDANNRKDEVPNGQG
jgi:NTP pyrophosphatase (non-canonical NTP hydrolase)